MVPVLIVEVLLYRDATTGAATVQELQIIVFYSTVSDLLENSWISLDLPHLQEEDVSLPPSNFLSPTHSVWVVLYRPSVGVSGPENPHRMLLLT